MVNKQQTLNDVVDLLDAMLDKYNDEIFHIINVDYGYTRQDVEDMRNKLDEWWQELEDGQA